MLRIIKEIQEFLAWRKDRLSRTKKNSVGAFHSNISVINTGNGMSINGRTIDGDFSGRKVSLVNGKVFVDGKELKTPDDKEPIKVEIHGELQELVCDGCEIKIEGNVGSINGRTSTIQCNTIAGDASVGAGSIAAGIIKGNASAGSGTIKAETIQGSVKTGSGTIKYNKT